jgi:uncharacterized protein (TIGR02145 family)
MKNFFIVACIIITASVSEAQETVTDYDGNVYQTVVIGNQTWLKQNLKSQHYSDGTAIPGAAAYNDNDSLANIYGRLYTWNATMRDSTLPETQGISPCGWHVPSDAEWSTLEAALGGAAVAGGKMKDTVSAYWNLPNTGASNSSAFSVLPAGEYDGFASPHVYQYLHEFSVFWTATQTNGTKAIERYQASNSAASSSYSWYKMMKYSVRCIKNSTTNVGGTSSTQPTDFELQQNYPNPFNPTTMIDFTLANDGRVLLKVYDVLGREVATLVNGELRAGVLQSVPFDASNLVSGMYYYRLESGGNALVKKLALLR